MVYIDHLCSVFTHSNIKERSMARTFLFRCYSQATTNTREERVEAWVYQARRHERNLILGPSNKGVDGR